MFWGLIMEPNKRYTQVVEKAFHISQAAMDISTGDNEPCQVMVVVDGKNFLVCTLQKTNNIQVPLDLYFKTGSSISFLTNGKCNVHLTGYLDPELEESSDLEEEEQEDEEEEAPKLVPANKRKLANNEDSTKSKKPKQEKKVQKKTAAEASDSDDDEIDPLQKFLQGDDIDTDENDESFKTNTSADGDESDEEDSDDDEEEEEEDEEDEGNDEEEDAEVADDNDTTLDTSKEENQIDISKLSKNARRRLKKKLQQEGKELPQVNGVAKSKDGQKQQKTEKKKPEAKKEAKKGVQEAGTGGAVAAAADKKEKKTLSGGVFIEDLKVGSGPVAKAGKHVMVYYEGRLKQNNKMFDSCSKGPGFKFRLGSKEVISGWDVGVAGMKVGGKRKIVCPPAMAYGAKGSPPVIPPNSTLVFEVELKNVK